MVYVLVVLVFLDWLAALRASYRVGPCSIIEAILEDVIMIREGEFRPELLPERLNVGEVLQD